MLKKLQYFWQLSYQRSPQENLTALRSKLNNKFQTNRQHPVNNQTAFEEANTVIPDLWERNYEVIVISDEDSEITAGNFLRFLACKK